jgi:hypothetical protein
VSLVGFQTALGRSVRRPPGDDLIRDTPDARSALELSPDERTRLRLLLTSPGFQFTVAVQRSWCESRAATTARQTLSILSAEERQRLLAEWVNRGGGTSSFVASEAEAFLEFIASRLPDPSHARTLCRVEQAAYRASSQVGSFEPPHHTALRPDVMLRTGAWAALVPFFVEPDGLVAALRHAESLSPFAEPICHLLFAPGISGLFRRASSEEVQLWARLARPAHIRTLSNAKHFRKLIEPLVAVGAIDVDSTRPWASD